MKNLFFILFLLVISFNIISLSSLYANAGIFDN